MSQSNLTSRLNEAIRLINEGRRQDARRILLDLSKQYPQLEQVWMWLATATDDTADRATYLRRVLAINPRNDKARAALTRLTGESVPSPAATRRSPAASSASASTRTLESWLIAILGLIVIVLVILAIVLIVPPLLAPHPTETPTPTLTASPTLKYSLTPSITPGGPTLTPLQPQTLPPSWTPSATALPSLTRTPADTSTPTVTFTASPTFVMITRPPTITPGGPTFTPPPPTVAPTVFTGATITPPGTPAGPATQPVQATLTTPTKTVTATPTP